MPSKPSKVMNIVIVGDVTMDWNLARIKDRSGYDYKWHPDVSTNISWQRGGAALIADLITQMSSDLETIGDKKISVFQTETPRASIVPTNPNFNHSFSIWSQFINNGQKAWRVSEFLGINRKSGVLENSSEWNSVVDEPSDVDILIIDDAATGFRDHPDFWPKCLLDSKSTPWVILKMSQPIGRGPLWDHLVENCSDRLIVLTTVDDLRRTEVKISKGLSWERTAQDLVWELEHNPQINSMSKCASLIVSFGTEGALVQNRPTQNSDILISKISQLVFDPRAIEGEWAGLHPGGMIGYTTCLVAGIARQLMLFLDAPDMVLGVRSGLDAMRDLHQGGYENLGSKEDPIINFPIKRVSQQLSRASNSFSVIDIKDPIRFLFTETEDNADLKESLYWSILQDRYRGGFGDICERVVLEGAEASLVDVPQGIFGGLFTVDRQEIESFRSIATLAGEYLNQEHPKRPLSIGVFGPPGSGKSFGVKQVAKTLAPGRIKELEFNLSQFRSIEELSEAMHQVRDVNLSGKYFPLVFWDEFDTTFNGKPLEWLRYFLAPMQDGEFREGQLTHPIGPAIFVFAGGTSEKMVSFGDGLDPNAFREAKVPDFISRLKGFVNVIGPNPKAGEIDGIAHQDPFFMIRRAILIRSILWRNVRHLFQKKDGIQHLNIDTGVLRAFLNVNFFKHGVRSIESIVAMSQLTGKTKYERSSLPPEAQLDLHVDGQEFLALAQQIELSQNMLNKLGALFHENYLSMMEKPEFKNKATDVDASMTDEEIINEVFASNETMSETIFNELDINKELKKFSGLSADEQEQNRDTVRHIYRKLNEIGYITKPTHGKEHIFKFPRAVLLKLAIMEHKRWVGLKLENGWRYAEKTDKTKKIHLDIVPWKSLSNIAKKKDIEFILAIPKILYKAGYTIIELRPKN